MRSEESYGREYFDEGVYARPKKEKEPVLRSFFDLLASRAGKVGRILDLGCGEGDFLEICQEKGWSCFGVDLSAHALAEAKKKVKGELLKVNLVREPLPFGDDFFDAVVCFDLVEHLKDPKLLLRESWRVLKPGGTFFLTTPNGGYWLTGLLRRYVADDPTHVNLQGKESWREELDRAGFSEVEIKGCLLFGFPPDTLFRHFLKRLKIPVVTRPIFFPVIGLASELFVFAEK